MNLRSFLAVLLTACGKGYDPDQPDRERRLLALRREEDQQGYIVMCAECTELTV